MKMNHGIYHLEKAQQYNDGTLGEWEVATVAGKPEIWHEYSAAMASADKRNMLETDGCMWRVEGNEQ